MNKDFFFEVFGLRWGFQYSPILHGDRPYMTRFILYLGPINLRLHKFYRGDDYRASHIHPWWFITFPFTTYAEELYKKGKCTGVGIVRRFRFHYRPAEHEHIVLGSVGGVPRPFWTFVIAGSKTQTWGFYRRSGEFVYWLDYLKEIDHARTNPPN